MKTKIGYRTGAAMTALTLAAVLQAADCAHGAELTLEDALTRSVSNSHILRAAEHEADRAGVNVRQARAERYLPRADVEIKTGLVNEAKGNAVESPSDRDDIEGLGPFFKIKLEVVQPLYTFGRLDSLEKAALEGLGAKRAQRDLTLQELTKLVVKSYWSLAAAMQASDVAGELRDSFYELLGEVEKRLDDEDSEIDDGDLLEVKSNIYRIEKVYEDARENRRRAGVALRALMGAARGEEIITVDEAAPKLMHGTEDFDRILVERGVKHKQLEALEAASRALASKVALTRAEKKPLVFVAAGAGHASAPNREDQSNPFVVDDYNYTSLGAEIGIRWSANFYKKNLNIEEVEQEYAALLETAEALRTKLTVEASDRFGRAARNRALLDAARKSLRASKSWLRLSLDNWELGLGEVSRILDAYEAYYEMKGVEIEMEREYSLSLVEVAAAMGDVGLYLEWLRTGKVVFPAL
jgi:outer membrane protein TolC